MKRHMVLRWTALVFALAALGLAIWFIATAPKTLRIAAGPEASQQVRFLQSVARALADGRESFRLDIVSVADSPAAAKLLESGKAKLALLRSDDPTAADARSIVVIQKRHLILVARQDRRIKDWSDMRGRTLGIVHGDSDSNEPLVERVLAQYGVDASAVRLNNVPLDVAPAALGDGEVDALVFVAFPGQRLRTILAEIAQRRETEIAVIGVSNAGALAFRYRDVETTQLPAGVLSGAPPLPPTSIDTIAITHEIVATTDLDEGVATDLTRTLIDAAKHIRRIEDNAFNIEAPPIDRPRRYPAHAGATAFVNNEAQTFLETYSDYIWLALFGLSIIGSSITGFLGWAGLREEPERSGLSHRMPELLERLEQATTRDEVDLVEEDFDNLVRVLIRDYASGAADATAEGDPTPMIRMFERLVEKRRSQLAGVRVAAQ